MISRLSQQRLGACGIATALSLLAISASVHATQTVDPTLTVGGASINLTTQAVPAGSTFTFYGMYTDGTAGAESGLGLKVKYNPAHLTNLIVSEEYTKCRIAAAQVQPLTPSTAQAVMGWVDTSIRTAGAVGWPDLADTAGGGATTACLNPGAINTDTTAGTAAAPGQKLFKVTATMAAGCTSAAACTSTVLFDSEGNFSYATTPSGFDNKSFTINGAAAPTCNLDVDNSGGTSAFVDGILVVRHLLNLSGATLTNNVAITGTRNVPADLTTFMSGINFDMSGAGSASAFRDGIILVRLMLNIPDTTLLNGVTIPVGATFQTAAQIRANVNAKCGTTF